MIAQPIEMLLVSANSAGLVNTLNPEAYTIHAIDDPGQAMESLLQMDYDLVVLDDRLLAGEIVGMVREIRRRFPLTPVLVLSDNKDTTYQTDLMEAGTTDFLADDLLKEELHRRLRLVLQQQRQNRALARRNSNLQALATLARRLHTATDPKSLVAETIDLACRTFKLYGMAIVMTEGEILHIYAGREGVTRGNLHDSTVRAHQYDPFNRVVRSGFVQTFSNIASDSYFTPIPVLPKAESALLVPLAYPEYTYGVIGVFGSASQPVNQDDLIIYELFAAQFTTALQNARHYEEQEKRVKTSSHLLRAWQRLITVNNAEDIAHNLRELVEDVPGVGQALVWLYEEDETSPGVVVNAHQQDVNTIFYDLLQRGHIDRLYEELDEGLQVTLQLGRGQKDPLGPLYRAMRAQQLMLFPITDSARLAGGMLVSSVNNTTFNIEDANLMKSLAHAAGQALVRNTLTTVMGEKGGRLEAILRSIYEGIFFVDNTGHVAFCNAQFTELTGISPSEVLTRDPDTLLRLLAERSDDPAKIHAHLQDAIRSIFDNPDENYSILEISLIDPLYDVHVEFSQIISTLNNEYLGWIGIIRDNTRFKSMFTRQMSLLDMMSEQVRVPHAELRGLVSSMIEHHTRLSNRERARFLRQIERSLENVGQLWENFIDMYNLDVTGLVLEREETDLYDVVQHVLENRLFHDVRRQIRVEAPSRLPLVRVDEQRIERVISNVLQNALSFSPKGAQVLLKLESLNDQVHIIVHDQGVGIPQDRLDHLFDPFYQVDDEDEATSLGLGLYISREVIHRHGGTIWADSSPGKGTSITIALPTAQSGGVVAAPPRTEYVEQQAAPTNGREEIRPSGYSVQKRQPKTIMVVEGRSGIMKTLHVRLADQGYEILRYGSGEEALSDVNAIRLDLIALDANLTDANGLEICERMRKRTEVPIVMLADDASEAEEIRALKHADAFITRPITEEQLMARVDVILKRVVDLPSRTREPLDLGDLYIDFARREVYLNNKPIELTRIEYDLLNTLAMHENHVLTHKQLLDKVWGPEYQAETQYLWVNVSRLRKKLEPTTDSPRYIHTQQGVGYVFRRP
jgi:two-component system KDP operon response regulator KdpE